MSADNDQRMEAGPEKRCRVCGTCGKVVDAPRMCACKMVYYCGEECQRGSWASHRRDCSVDLLRKLEEEREEEGEDSIHAGLAAFQLGLLFFQHEWMSDAEEWLLETVRVLDLVLGEDHMALADAKMRLGNVYEMQSKWAYAYLTYEEVITICRWQPEDEEEEEERQRQGETRALPGDCGLLASATLRKGGVLALMGNPEDAMPTISKANEMFCRLSDVGEGHESAASVLSNVAITLDAQGKQAESLATEQKALDILRRSSAPGGDDVAQTLVRMGNLHMRQGMAEGALPLFLEALSIARRNHPVRSGLEGKALVGIGDAYRERGMLEEALGVHRKARSIIRRTLGPATPEAIDATKGVANVLQDLERRGEAIEAYEELVETLRGAHGDDHLWVAGALYDLGVSKGAAMDVRGSLECLGMAKEICRRMMARGGVAARVDEALAVMEAIARACAESRREG